MSNVAAFLGGAFFAGIPNWVLLLLFAIFLLGGVFERWGVWLKEHGQNARVRCNEKIASHRADELQDRMLVLEDRIGHRAAKLTKEIVPIVGGKGGGRPDMAEGGGSEPEKLPEALEASYKVIETFLSS